MDQQERSNVTELRRLIDGYQVAQAISVSAALGIADALRDGPLTSDDLAAIVGADRQALYRLLRALATIGVFREEEGRRFALTPLSEHLRSDSTAPLGPWAKYSGRPYIWQAWGNLLHSVVTGENAFQHTHGVRIWEYRAGHPEENAIFDHAMSGVSRGDAEAVLAACDFGRFHAVMDVGGGQGTLLAAILDRHSSLRGVLFDQPHVVARAQPVLAAARVADRCTVVGGSFFDAVPEGCDAYLLRHCLNIWEDEPAIAVLRACRRAIGQGGTLLVIERVVGPANEGRAAKFMDLQMLVGPGGQERTAPEYAALFAAAGFALTGITSTDTDDSIIEGMPIT